MDDGYQLGPGTQKLFVLVEQQLAVIIDGDDAQSGTALLAQDLPGDDIGVVLHGGNDDFVALSYVLAAVALGYQVDSFSGAPYEDDLTVVRGVEELPYLGPGTLVVLSGPLAQGVDPPVHVGVFRGVVPDQGVDDYLGFLAGGGTVQVDQRPAVDLLFQDREVLPDFCWVKDLGGLVGNIPLGRGVGCGHEAAPN